MTPLEAHILILTLVLLASGSVSSAAGWDVTKAGAAGDGVTDDTAAFQKALDEAGNAGGGIVHVPAGRYCIKGNLVIPGAVTLQGTYRVPPVTAVQGSVLEAYAGRGSEDGEPFIRLAGLASTVSGLAIAYPEWKQSDVPPVPYPPCIAADGHDNVGVTDCLLMNPYEGIRLERAGRHLVRNVYGYPIKRGLYVDECHDVGRIENIHFWPFGVAYKQDDPYCKWINVNGVAIEFARTDWQYVTNCFCFGYGVGYKFSASAAGACNGNFLGIGADSCQRAILVEQCTPYGLLITNGEFVGRWGSNDSVCVDIAKECAGKVSLTNCAFWGPIDRCVWLKSGSAQFTANACNFVSWDVAGSGSPAIDVEAGKAIVQGCTFGSGTSHVDVAANAKSVVLMGNQAEGGLVVRNLAGERTVTLGNEQSTGE